MKTERTVKIDIKLHHKLKKIEYSRYDENALLKIVCKNALLRELKLCMLERRRDDEVQGNESLENYRGMSNLRERVSLKINLEW